MKKLVALLFALLLVSAAPLALAADNVTIAVVGRDGFNDYVSNLIVWDGRLLLNAYNTLYTWSKESGLTKVEGFENIDALLAPQVDEDGDRYVVIGDEEFDLEEDESLYFSSDIIAADDRLYKTAVLSGEDGTIGTMLVELIIDEDGSLSLGEIVDLGDLLVEDYGDGYTGYTNIDATYYMDGIIYGLAWTMNGRELLAVDIENEDVDTLSLDVDGEINGMAAFDEGRLLMISVDYNADPFEYTLLVYDVEEEEVTELGALPSIGYDSPTALCYDEERGKLYYELGGSLWRMDVLEDGLGAPEEFADMPLSVYSDSNAVLLDNLYIVSSFEGVVGRDVTVDQAPEEHLIISNNYAVNAINSAYFDFIEAHPEYMVSIRSSGLVDRDTLLQQMLTRSSDTDIFVMASSDSAFVPLITRGYMAELSGSEKLTALMDSVYPQMRDLGSKDGVLYAVPVELYASSIAINKPLLTEKLGIAEDELPETWTEMFAMIAKLSDGRMKDTPEVTLLGSGITESDACETLLNSMLNSFLLWIDKDEANLKRGEEVLRELLDAFEQIDWTGFGMPLDYEDDNMMWEWNPENMVMSTNTITIFANRGNDASQTVLPLAITEGEDPMIAGSVTYAFVNPFSKHREAAIEYLETTMDNLDETTLAQIIPTRNDPIEDEYYEENLQYYIDNIADMEESLAKAEEEEDDETIAILTESIEENKEWMADYEENYRWSVSPESIAAYREQMEYFVPQTSSVWSGDSGNLYTQIRQYVDGTLTAQQFVAEFSKQVTMHRQEGV